MDIGFLKDNRYFRYRAAAIIIEGNCVLFAGNERDDYYYSVGGAVHHGEKAEDAVKREVFEETGVHYDIERLAYIHENFFKAEDNGKEIIWHEVTLYFLMKPRGTKELNSNSYNMWNAKETMHWLPIDKLKEYKAYPTFFADKLLHMDSGVEHIVTSEY